MCRPPVVHQEVENGEQEDKEGGGPSCLEAYGNHDACAEAEDGNKDAEYRPVALQDEAEEEEDEENPSSELHRRASQRRKHISKGAISAIAASL